MTGMLFMVIEHFTGGAARVYERYGERGRMAPDGLQYVASWVTSDLRTCYQVMQCDDEELLRTWAAHWADIVDFEFIPVMTSAAAAEQHSTAS
jgi:Protein of unknown function (DUF3303)